MPPKGVKAALLAGRGKPIRTSTTTRPGESAEVKLEMKRGLCEKMNAKIITVSLDRFLGKKKQEGAQSEVGTVASLDTAEQPGFIGTESEPRLQKGLEGTGSKIPDETAILKNHCDTPSQIDITDNHIDITNSRQVDKSPTQLENVQQWPPDGNGG
ncbi:hypothetical protein NDU88_009826 [Pleurodeles waltl]|uniref:Uncharacterized protein n=1 Tax=Pleurodeles waltl TaxID=8319 RepID=A0AAV7QYL0_PLEWA|nr:hypothetical protein NDU88_009826 [Pleurodeles waltl]